MRYNKNEIVDEIIFDRDTSAPKNKMKNNRRLRRPQQRQEIPNSATTDKKINSDKSDEIKNKLQPKSNNLTMNQKKNINSEANKNQNKYNSNANNNSDINKKGNENDINNNKDKEIEQNNKNKKEEEVKNKKTEEREREKEKEKNENEKNGNISGKNENNKNAKDDKDNNDNKNILNKNAKGDKDNNDNNNNINDDNYNNKKGNKKNQNNKGRNGKDNDSSDEEDEYSKNKNKHNKQKNKNNINNTSNIDKQDAFIQVNLMNELVAEEKNKIAKQYKLKESEYKEKIYNLKEDIENLKDENKQQIINLKNEINSKKEEIIRLTNLNSKLKRNAESMTEKINNLYNKMLEKNKLNSINYNAGINTNTNANKFRTYNSNFNKGMNNDDNNENENSNNNNGNGIGNGNTDLNEIIKIKDKQIRDSLSMISYLTKEKNRLKEELFNLKDQTKNVNNSAIINKNKINLLKTTNQKFNLNRPNQNNGSNIEIGNGNEIGNENGDEAEKNNNINDMDLVNNENDLLQRRIKYGSTIYKNMLLKSKNNKRATSAKNLLEEKKKLQENVHVKMNKLFNDEERKALSTLFKSSEEFDYFNQKINVLHNHNTAIERKLLIKIRSLKIDNDDKDEQIQYLQEKLRECETKLKIMENKYNYEKFLTRQNRKGSYNNQTSG